MNLIKQLLTDAKKQRAMVGAQQNKNNLHHKGDLVNIPTIEVDEVQTMYIDDKLFEYDMIQRAREAELILSEILNNYQQGKYSRISETVDQLLTKLKIKHNNNNQKNNNNSNNSGIPKIQIVDVDHNKSMQSAEGKFEMDYETLIRQATEAQIILSQLLDCNCHCMTASFSEDDDDEVMSTDSEESEEKQEQEIVKRPLTRTTGLHHSPSKRISLKGETYTLMENMTFNCQHKKRRITLDFSTSLTSKINCKDAVDSFNGTVGTFVYKDVSNI